MISNKIKMQPLLKNEIPNQNHENINKNKFDYNY